MRKLTPIDMKPWTLPLAVLGLVVPIVVATLLVGSVGAFVAGAVMVAVLIVLAARATYDEEIEVAAPTDDRYHVIVVVTAAIDDPSQVEQVVQAARRGPEALSRLGEAEVLVLAPALNPGIAHWASDLRAARIEAQERLAVSIASLAAAGLDARGQVGDTDPVQAIEDELRAFPAQELLLVAPPGHGADLLDEVRRRLDRPVRRIDSDGSLSQPRRREDA